jgi:NRAMP (natural resistance-associated macrophage protein)-like metal ion transporter
MLKYIYMNKKQGGPEFIKTISKRHPRKRSLLESLVSAPANILGKTINKSIKIGSTLKNGKAAKRAGDFWHMLGPGLTTGAADDDCSGVATYSQAGARYGFQWLWLAPITFPLMAVTQEMCARIGMVTGEGLAANIRKHFPRWVLYTATALLFAANTFNLGADLGAMAEATRLIFPQFDFSFLVVAFAMTSLALQIFTTYQKYAKYLKYLALTLLSYVFTMLIVKASWSDILYSTLVPSFNLTKDGVLLITGVLGTTISPYLFFWQTSQEIEEEILEGKTSIKSRLGASKLEIKRMRADVWSGMFLSNLVMFAIIATCGATLFSNGIQNIETAAQAASALRPLAGNAAYLLFALGIVSTGLLAIPVLAGSISYALSESFHWEEGLYKQLEKAKAFYGVIIISMFVGLMLNFVGLDPIKALVYSAIANGVVAPVVLILIVLLSSNKRIMGEWANGNWNKFFGWLVTWVMVVAGGATIFALFN